MHRVRGAGGSGDCPSHDEEAWRARAWTDAQGQTGTSLVGQPSTLGVFLSTRAWLLDASRRAVVRDGAPPTLAEGRFGGQEAPGTTVDGLGGSMACTGASVSVVDPSCGDSDGPV